MSEKRERSERDDREKKPNKQQAETAADDVEEASEESFPASDPPAWGPIRSGPPSERDEDEGDR
jgi:hypothetical protein